MSAIEAFVGQVVAAAIIREICASHSVPLIMSRARSTAREALLVDALRSLQPLDTLS